MARSVTITLNGRRQELPDGLTVRALLERLALTGRRTAVEINGEIVPRSMHETRPLAAGDRIEIVHAIGGG